MSGRVVTGVDGPHRLDAVEEQTWQVLAAVLVHLPAALDGQLQRDAGMSWFEYQVLAALARSSDRSLRLTDLAEAVEASLSKLSRAIDRLVRRGWMERRTDAVDGRYTLGVLTDDGQQRVELAAPGHADQLRRLVFDTLSPDETRRLGELGTRMRHALAPAATVPRPR